MLSGLGAEWTVLHAVPIGCGKSDIGHVVIGPAGIFTINTKNHADHKIFVSGSTFLVSGQNTNTCATPSTRPRGPPDSWAA